MSRQSFEEESDEATVTYEIVMAGAGGPNDPPHRPSMTPLGEIVCPGESIQAETGFLRGHGTYVESGELISSVSGIVERVNKLISVRPLRSRYGGEVGDVVIGRITGTQQKRWKVDIQGRQDAVLQLSSIILPGGVQRRRTAEDELNMRSFFTEDDLISAEVQSLYSDGAVALHTRSSKYGKLESGVFVAVSASLIKRSQQHFVSLPCGVDVILGTNGYVWVTTPVDPEDEGERIGVAPKRLEVTAVAREKIARVRNAIEALDRVFAVIAPGSIERVYQESISRGLKVKDMLDEKNIVDITRSALALNDSGAHAMDIE